MQKTRLRLMLDYPFFGSLALTLQHIQDDQVPTCCTDGKSLRFNPEFINSLTPNEKLFLYLHEICHIILGHSVRRGNRDPKLWNIAGDHAVNLLLRDSVDLPRPEGGLMDTQFLNMSAEVIYKKLERDFPEDVRNANPPPRPDTPPEESQDSPQSQEEPPGEWDETEPPLPMDEDNPEQPNARDGETDHADDDTETTGDFQDDPEVTDPGQADGDNSDNSDDSTPESNTPDPERLDRIERYRDAVESMERFGMVEDPDEELGLTEADIQSTTSLIDRMLNNSNNGAPEPIQRLIRQFVSTRVPWQELLASFIYQSCEQQYNWMKPNRRFSSSNFVLPSLERKQELSIVIVIDTSGSIDDNLLNLFMSELTSLMTSVEYTQIHIVSCSDQIFNPQDFAQGESIDYQPTGEGETLFAPAFDHVQTLDPPPACVIYFTDLFSDDFGTHPGMPVLWIGNYDHEWMASHQARVPYGDIVTMYEED